MTQALRDDEGQRADLQLRVAGVQVQATRERPGAGEPSKSSVLPWVKKCQAIPPRRDQSANQPSVQQPRATRYQERSHQAAARADSRALRATAAGSWPSSPGRLSGRWAGDSPVMPGMRLVYSREDGAVPLTMPGLGDDWLERHAGEAGVAERRLPELRRGRVLVPGPQAVAGDVVGIKTSQMGASYEDILGIWRQADAVPVFEHAWLWDHMVPLRGPVNAAALEAWTLLAALAVKTDRLQLGVMVTSNRLRYPSVLAKMAATVDVISGGRLVFGIGAGGSEIPGADPAVMEIVHREFDASPAFTAEDFQRMNEKLDEHCAAVGRDPGEVIRSAQILIRPGDPAAARDLILQFIGVGATHLVIAPIPPFESVQWLADEIVESP